MKLVIWTYAHDFSYCSLAHPPAPHPPAPPPPAFSIQTDAILFTELGLLYDFMLLYTESILNLDKGLWNLPIKFVRQFLEKRYSSTLLGYPTQLMTCDHMYIFALV